MDMENGNSTALVALSILMAIFASFTALNLSGRITEAEPAARRWWILAAAVALGGGTWTMHFVGMLSLSMHAAYDVELTLVSLLVPITVSGVGLHIVSRFPRSWAALVLSGLLVGSGVVVMHYAGMAAKNLPGVVVRYDALMVAASIAVAIVAAIGALWLAFRTRGTWQRLAAGVLMGGSISGMHYTAMVGANFEIGDTVSSAIYPTVPQTILAFGVSAAAILLLLLALATAFFDRKLATLTMREAARLQRSEERLRLIQEASGMADFETDAGGFSVCSARFFAQVGLPFGDGTIDFPTWITCVHPSDRDHVMFEVEAALAHKNEFSSEFRIVHAETGETRWLSSRTKVVRNEKGEVVSTIGAHLDITERKRAQAALSESEERFRLAADVAGLGIWDYDPATGKRQWSELLKSILGLPIDAEPDLELATRCVHPADRASFTNHLQELLHGQQAGIFETSFRICRADDKAERWLTMNGSKSIVTSGGVGRLIVTVRDSTAETTAAELAQWSANHDPLTGLANRRLFQLKLEEALGRARATQYSVGMLLLDLDHFKQINDTLGHDAGDELLKMFAKRLQSVLRTGDTIARFGGDEFAILVSRLEKEDRLNEISQSILDGLREPFVHAGRILDCRASIGVSIFPKHGSTPEELLKNADMALYSAKHAGRGTAISFEPRMRADAQRRINMVQLGRNAVRDDRVVPYYQPKISLIDGSVVGFEALLRWRAANGRIQHPKTIEAAFEDLEVAAEISDRMIERTLADMRGWLDRGVRFGHVAVNAAAAEFRQDNFAERLLDRLKSTDIPTHHFQLEVTETVFLGRGADFVHRALGLLSSAGIKIALDDFGTGYASLRHLKEFPVDIMKIDRSFVRDMEIDQSDEAIIRAVINLGRNLDIKIVAEGIETQAQAEKLITLGCDYGQGFLFSKAVPASRVPAIASLVAHKRSEASDCLTSLRLISASDEACGVSERFCRSTRNSSIC